MFGFQATLSHLNAHGNGQGTPKIAQILLEASSYLRRYLRVNYGLRHFRSLVLTASAHNDCRKKDQEVCKGAQPRNP